jgi:steroid delta-isomerase-like uncharacterized protein
MSARANKEAIERALEAFNAGDFTTYLELYAPSVVAHGFGPEPLDLAGLAGFYATVGAAFSGARVAVDELIGEDDRIGARYTFQGTHTGEFMGVPATGRAVAVPGQTVMHFVDGRCTERWQSLDALGLLVQIGAMPAPA